MSAWPVTGSSLRPPQALVLRVSVRNTRANGSRHTRREQGGVSLHPPPELSSLCPQQFPWRGARSRQPSSDIWQSCARRSALGASGPRRGTSLPMPVVRRRRASRHGGGAWWRATRHVHGCDGERGRGSGCARHDHHGAVFAGVGGEADCEAETLSKVI